MNKLSPEPKHSNATADKWMREGINCHEQFQRAFLSAKGFALNAGIFFLSAKDSIAEGGWEFFKDSYSSKISVRSIERYCEFAREALQWAKSEYPDLLGNDKLVASCREMVIQSPKGLIALCRELKLMRKFGEYDEVKYRTRKILGAGQIEFPFETIFSSVVSISKLGQANCLLKLPEGKTEREAYEELEANLQAALDTVRAKLSLPLEVEA